MAKIELTCIWFATRTYHLKAQKLFVSKKLPSQKSKERKTFMAVKSWTQGITEVTDFKFHANDKFLNGQKLAWICLSFTRDPRKRASFWKENSTAICYRICTGRCKRFAHVKNPSFQKFVRNRLNGVLEVLDPNRGSLSSPCKRTQLCWMLWVCCILLRVVGSCCTKF